MKVIVCGSRGWRRIEPIQKRLADLPDDATIITGGADGADYLADKAAAQLALDRIIVPANWKRHGKAAGPIRNQRMLDLGPNLVIAFRLDGTSRGTDDMVDRALGAGVEWELILI